MPFLNAAEVLEIIQAQNLYGDVIKMVWSTSRQPEHINRCLKAGAADYFVKPVDVSELNKIAKTIIEADRRRENSKV